jgi:hypothetical protein
MDDISFIGIPFIIFGVISWISGIFLFSKPKVEKDEFLGDSFFSVIVYLLPWWGRKILFITLGTLLVVFGIYFVFQWE